MAHVAQVKTFLLPNWRNRGIGRLLQPCGRLSRQLVIDGLEDDEVLVEFFC